MMDICLNEWRWTMPKLKSEGFIKVNPAQRERSDRVPGVRKNICVPIGTHYDATLMSTYRQTFIDTTNPGTRSLCSLCAGLTIIKSGGFSAGL